MKPDWRFTLVVVVAVLLTVALPAWSMTAAQQQQFERILTMNIAELTEAAQDLLNRKFPGETWSSYNFPAFVYTNAAVETGYKIAVKEPALLGQANLKDQAVVIPCYCFCDRMGHDNLLECFLKEGRLEAGFDIHAAGCKVCYGQAMEAFLWNDLGASHDEIIAGMERKYQKLIKMKQAGEL